MPNIFAIGDVHGCAEELQALIHKLPLDQDSVLVFLGDYVDRGPDSKGVIDTVLDLSEIYSVIALKGNHEWLMQQYLEKPNDPVASGNFILNGGSATLASYSTDGVTFSIPSAHREFLNGLLLFHVTEKHFYVHAGIPPNYDFHTKPDEKMAHQFLWIRNVFLDSKQKWPRIIVHGHTPVEVAEQLPNRINLDTGCVFGRRLTAMNMGTGEIYSVARNQVERPTFLTQTLRGGGHARAQRFEGNVGVEILVGNQGFPFQTINYNEFGLLITPAEGSEELDFTIGQKVDGLIKPGGANIFHFTATVMRKEAVKGVPNYGLRFDKLENLAEL